MEISACNQLTYFCGSASLIGGEPDPGGLAYGMTGAFHIDAGATGTLTLPFIEPDVQTRVRLASGVGFSIGQINDAVLNIPTGRCCDGNCADGVTLNACFLASQWEEGASCPPDGGSFPAACGTRSRYATVRVPATATTAAIQVTVTSMPLNPARIGEIWWAGPSETIANTPDPAIKAAPLQCETMPSHVEVWPTGNLHLFDGPIVPGARYSVRFCDATGSNCSGPQDVITGQWGDVIPPYSGSGQPDFTDISSVNLKFGFGASTPDISRADLRGPGNPGFPNTPDGVIDFTDISADVDAFSGVAYPFAVSACPASRIGR